MEELVEIVATVESELERRVADLEQRISELMASGSAGQGRKTVKSFAASAEGTLDDALKSLSVEQRIAVKMEMMRSGLG